MERDRLDARACSNYWCRPGDPPIQSSTHTSCAFAGRVLDDYYNYGEEWADVDCAWDPAKVPGVHAGSLLDRRCPRCDDVVASPQPLWLDEIVDRHGRMMTSSRLSRSGRCRFDAVQGRAARRLNYDSRAYSVERICVVADLAKERVLC